MTEVTDVSVSQPLPDSRQAKAGDGPVVPEATAPERDCVHDGAAVAQWNVSTRIVFRFCFVYFGLFCLGVSQILLAYLWLGVKFVPGSVLRWLALSPPREWVAVHLFHLDAASLGVETGSGDRPFDWVSVGCWLVAAVAVTGVWSVLDRRRPNYMSLYKWFRVFIRLALAGQMISYGLAKAIPTQMPFPSLQRLIQPFGTFSPMGVLWSQVGSSPPYEIALGCVEILGGLLLILPRTTTLGAVVCSGATAQIFLLNMTYDVPVKILSLHLLLLSLFLLAPQARRLSTFFLSKGPVDPPTEPDLLRSRRANRIAVVAQVVLGLWIVATNLHDSWAVYQSIGPGREKPPLYGIWNVADFARDGQTRAPLLTDQERWRRVIFDHPGLLTFQRMDDSFGYIGATIDTDRHTLELTNPPGKSQIATFAFSQPGADRLTLDGEMYGSKVRMLLERVDKNSFRLVNRGFHWVQRAPYNR